MSKKQLSASEWLKFCNTNPSLSDVITIGYHVNSYPSSDDEDFGTADLSGYKDDTGYLDALKYSMQGIQPINFTTKGMKVSAVNGSEFVGSVDFAEPKKTCTCGTHKTYGAKASLSMHSSWCDFRN
jgi:hypothetical protein